MRILFQYYTSGGGGLSNIILLLRALSKVYPDDQLIVVCARGSKLSELSALPNMEVVFYGRDKPSDIDRLLLGCFGLKKIVKKYHIDLVWSLNVGTYVKLQVPHVLSVNNAYQIYPLDLVAGLHPKNKINLLFLRAFFQRTLRLSNAVILQTDLMREYAHNIKKTPPIHVISKSVEQDNDVIVEPLPLAVQSKLNIKKMDFTFLYVATYMPHKNHQLLIQVLDILFKASISVRLILTITYDELIYLGGNKVQLLIEAGYIVPVGWVKKQHLASLYQQADACLMPSLLESLSSAHLEAMQWGKPQITSDLRFSRDLCGEGAVYVAADNPNQWARNMIELMSNAALRQSLVCHGHARMANFPQAWDDAAHLVHEVLARLVTTDEPISV